MNDARSATWDAILEARRMAKVARRRFQNGQLFEDKGRWVGRWREDVRGVDGRIRRVRRQEILAAVKDTTKRMAQRLLDERLERVNRASYRPEWAGTFQVFAEKWERTVLLEHKPSSQASERSVIAVHLVPGFGELRLREITAEVLQGWVSSKRGQLAPKTIRNVVRTLGSMWTTARKWRYVDHDPIDGLILPTIPKGNVYHFTVEEAREIIRRAPSEKWRLFFRILAETGIRPGELAGLLRSNCSLRSIAVTQSVWARQVQTPKSAAGVRRFAISEELGRAIEAFVATSDANQYGLVFVTDKWRKASGAGEKQRLNQHEGGKPLSMDTFRQRVLDPILEELGIRARVKALGIRCGNYAFRHLNATQMDQWGTPLKTRQKRLGHANAAVTLDHYTEALDVADLEVADRFGELLRPGPEIIQ